MTSMERFCTEETAQERDLAFLEAFSREWLLPHVQPTINLPRQRGVWGDGPARRVEAVIDDRWEIDQLPGLTRAGESLALEVVQAGESILLPLTDAECQVDIRLVERIP